MSTQELMRAEVCVRVVSGEFSIADAASRVGVSYRHMKRIVRRYRKRGAAGLVHQSLGRPSNRSRLLAEVRAQALELVREFYSGPPGTRFGPTLIAEHLESDHGLRVCSESLRHWMIDAGLWSLSRKRKPYRKRRERRAHFGELVQGDGSVHEWLGDRGPAGWLITFIDDSRSECLARFAEAESTWSVAQVFEAWISRYGIPRQLYVDCGGVFGRPGKKREKMPVVTQFARMCSQLGTQLIHARSPQAKGRVERVHGTHQDRLIKKMRLAGISNYDDANEFLDGYLRDHNRRFAVASLEEADFHLPLSDSIDLSRVFSLHSERIVSLDAVVCYNRRRFQITRASRLSGGQKVSVEEARNGTVRIFASGIELPVVEFSAGSVSESGEHAEDHNSVHRRPTDNHPWRYPRYDRAAAEAMRQGRAAALAPTPTNQSELIPT